jgi:hypothetical protein
MTEEQYQRAIAALHGADDATFADCDAHQATIAALREALDSSDRIVQVLKAQVASKDDLIAMLRSTIAAQDRAIAAYIGGKQT